MVTSPLHQGNALAVTLLQEIHRNYNAIRFDQFAALHGVSAAYVSKLMRRVTGKSCTELLQTRRLTKAADLLSRTNLSVLEICAAVGYSNSSHFYRIFEKEFGCSPSEWRKKSRPQPPEP